MRRYSPKSSVCVMLASPQSSRRLFMWCVLCVCTRDQNKNDAKANSTMPFSMQCNRVCVSLSLTLYLCYKCILRMQNCKCDSQSTNCCSLARTTAVMARTRTKMMDVSPSAIRSHPNRRQTWCCCGCCRWDATMYVICGMRWFLMFWQIIIVQTA